jgi:hypothetical protein
MPGQQVPDRRRVPTSPASRPDAAGVQGGRDPAQGLAAGRLDLADNGRDVDGVAIGLGSIGNRSSNGRLAKVGLIAQPRPGRLLGRQCRASPLRNQVSLLLGQGSVEMEHERVRVGTQLGHDERHPLRHQAADERDITAQTIQLRHDHRAFRPSRRGQSGGEMRAPVQGIGALPDLYLDDLINDGVALMV